MEHVLHDEGDVPSLVASPKCENLDLPVALQSAIEHHQSGRLQQAEAIYRQILRQQPNSPAALHMLGLLSHQTGRNGLSLDLIGKALVCRPDLAEIYFNFAAVLLAEERESDAAASIRRAILVNHYFAEAYNNLGAILLSQGLFNRATAASKRAILLKPDYTMAYANLGNAFKGRQQNSEAIICYRRAICIKSDYAEAYCNMGVVLQAQGYFDKALEHFKVYIQTTDWQSSLFRLTTPLVLQTGLILASAAEAPNINGQSKRERGQGTGSMFSSRTATFEGNSQATHSSEHALPTSEVKKTLRIALVYPPPWRIPCTEDERIEMADGPPLDKSDGELNSDFQILTYGLLTIAAQAKRAGYAVDIHNLSSLPWRDVVTAIADTDADVYGISAFTANRRGLGAVSTLIRQLHPNAHITAGGPFVTALPLDTLKHYPDIDTVVIGEGEITFMELLECLKDGRKPTGIPGTAWRGDKGNVIGPVRPRINDLDSLASPFDYYSTHILMTSRGCPSKCTFCGSSTTWGKALRFHSAEYALDDMRKALGRLPIPYLAIKDDTFTAHRRRTLQICDSIIQSKMNFIWSCDTRVDSLDDEILCKMRQAGCQMISIGVESGSQEILKAMRKRTTPEMVLTATRAAQKYGMYVRYYMIVPNRGETAETIRQTIQLITDGRPSNVIFCPLAFFPGTEDWEILCEKQGLTSDVFFTNNFKELNCCRNRIKELQDVLLHIFVGIDAIDGYEYTLPDREAIARRLPSVHSVHVELANAYLRAGRLDEAKIALDRAQQLDFPISNIIFNQRACIALARGEVDVALGLLELAAQHYPHRIVMENLQKLRTPSTAPRSSNGILPLLNDSVQAMHFGLI